MKVFISWSGDLSKELAEVIRDWLPAVLQNVKPFFTPSDIEKGARWSKDISLELEASAFGIFCLTRENLAKPWIMFEAGALSKRVDASRVCPVLFGIDSTDLEGPLVQFQAAPFSETEFRKLVRSINAALNEHKLDDSVLGSVFEMWWPRLNDRVTKVLHKYATQTPDTPSVRSDRDLLEELLKLARLNTSPEPKRVRRVYLGDREPLRYTLNSLLNLCDLVYKTDDPDLLQGIRDVFDPLKEFIAAMIFSPSEVALQRGLEGMIEDLDYVLR